MKKALANIYRGERIESFHTGSIAVVSASGRLLAWCGDPSSKTYLRSAAKPFQAIPLLEYGGADEFDLQPAEIALICASHGGEPMHISSVAALLRHGEFDESDLLCGAHAPYDEKAAAELRAAGESPSPLHNNCSGKHAGMLLATSVMDEPSEQYIDAHHPLQETIAATLGTFVGMPGEEIPTAIDGCGVPAYYLSLHRAALAYARLMETAHGGAATVDQYEESARIVTESMTGNPHYVAGAWSMTTPLMKAFKGGLLAKEGAEGFYAMALSPELTKEAAAGLPLADGSAIGIALKIDDGSMGRGRNPVILRTLELLGLDVRSRPELERYQEWPLRNVAGTLVGEVRAEFTLEIV